LRNLNLNIADTLLTSYLLFDVVAKPIARLILIPLARTLLVAAPNKSAPDSRGINLLLFDLSDGGGFGDLLKNTQKHKSPEVTTVENAL